MVQKAAAAERNKKPISTLLGEFIRAGDRILEVASGTGQHVDYFARQYPAAVFCPSELHASQTETLTSQFSDRDNIEPARQINVVDSPLTWGAGSHFDGVIVANLFHISAVQTVPSFFAGVAHVLKESGFAHVYGPFKQSGRHTSPGNARFDVSLRQQNPDWGIRDIETVKQHAAEHGFVDAMVFEQPANNLSIVLRR